MTCAGKREDSAAGKAACVRRRIRGLPGTFFMTLFPDRLGLRLRGVLHKGAAAFISQPNSKHRGSTPVVYLNYQEVVSSCDAKKDQAAFCVSFSVLAVAPWVPPLVAPAQDARCSFWPLSPEQPVGHPAGRVYLGLRPTGCAVIWSSKEGCDCAGRAADLTCDLLCHPRLATKPGEKGEDVQKKDRVCMSRHSGVASPVYDRGHL